MLKSGQSDSKENCPGRLKKRPEFLSVAGAGQKWVSETVIVQVKFTGEADAPRFGYTATKKIGNAVVRNRAKRRLRSAVVDIVKTYNIKPADIVLIARDTTGTCDWEKLLKDLKWCFKRLEILNPAG